MKSRFGPLFCRGELQRRGGLAIFPMFHEAEPMIFLKVWRKKPIKFVALKPDEVIERVKKNLVKDAHDRTKRLETLKSDEVLEELNTIFTQGIKFVEPTDLSGSLKGRQNIYNQLDMMVRNAERSVTIVTTREGLNRKMEALLPSFEKAKKRGVKIRIAAPVDANNIKVARELRKVAEVKSMEKMRARFTIIDSNQVLFMLLDDEKFHPNYDTGVWINTEFFAQALEQLFELAWKDMKSVK